MSCSEWREVKLGEITKIKGRIGWKGYKTTDLRDCGPVVLGGNNIKNSIYLDLNDVKYLSREKYEESPEIMLKQDDILVVTRGSGIGDVSFFNGSIKEATINPSMVILTQCIENPKFLFYYLISAEGRRNILSVSSGSSIPAIYQKSLATVKCTVPSIEEQKAIAATLSCLDDKIKLNNRINKNLEEMAQAIFKSWFVDFEPFQDGEFVESEFGRIPNGWRVGTISDLGDVIGGSTPSKACSDYYTDRGIAWITPKDLSVNKDKFISKGEIDITELGFKKSSTRVMPKGTVLFSSRAPIGYIAIAKNDVTTNQGFKSVVPKRNIGTPYVFYFLKNNVNLIENRASGSTFKEVSGSVMKQIPAVIPDDNVLKEFENICGLYFEKQRLLEGQNRQLSAIRDTLLPKLMSGEIRVPIEEVE